LRRFLVFVAEKTAGRIVYVSDDNRTRLPMNSVSTAVVPNPVEQEIYLMGCSTPYTPRRSGRFEVLMLASPRDFKGIPEFLDLAKRLSRRPDIIFTLVLNGDVEEVAHYLPYRSVPTNMTVHPRTDTPARFYATADVLLNLSRPDQWIETFGLTLVEGMAFGLPVIAPPIGGPTELVSEGQEGFLVDSRDGETLQRRIVELADVPELAMSMSTAARLRSNSFTYERFSKNLREQVDMLLGGSNLKDEYR
jgi:glycosyltransferase involved in cell wall biosynthesis